MAAPGEAVAPRLDAALARVDWAALLRASAALDPGGERSASSLPAPAAARVELVAVDAAQASVLAACAASASAEQPLRFDDEEGQPALAAFVTYAFERRFGW